MRSPKAREFLALMRHAARSYADQRGWQNATQVTLFCPQWVVAQVLGVDTSTIRRWFYRYDELRSWIGTQLHYTSISAGDGRRTVIDGMLWTVRLREGRGDVRVPFEDLKFGYRDLEFDINNGRVSHASQPTEVEGLENRCDVVLGWSFGVPETPPVSADACSLPEAFAQADWDDDFVQPLAWVIARNLGDRHSLRFWIRTVRQWRDRGRLTALQAALQRALTDQREGAARNAAALAVHRLTPRVAAVA